MRSLPKLLLWFLVVYLLMFHLSPLIRTEDQIGELSKYLDPVYPVRAFFTALSWFTYSLAFYLLLRRFYGRIYQLVLLIFLAMATLATMFSRAFWEEVVSKSIIGVGNYNPDMTWTNYLFDQVLYAVIFCSLGTVFFFVERSRWEREARQRSELLQRETELKFLRSQVNPHFLFNVLNNLYSLVNEGSPRALPVLEKLSSMLRYSLYESAATVPLQREIAHLRDLIVLEEMRVAKLEQVEFRVGRFSQEWRLPPLLLLPFVENAFKHGELGDPQRPLKIFIGEDASANLTFTVENAVGPTGKQCDGNRGIGVANVRKRLQLLYPNRHRLEIVEKNDNFRVALTLNRGGDAGAMSIPAEATPISANDRFSASQNERFDEPRRGSPINM